MASKQKPGKSEKAPARSASPKGRGELDVKDLDKVTGGLRASSVRRTGDPCDGGEAA
jgi:hypothetical protein